MAQQPQPEQPRSSRGWIWEPQSGEETESDREDESAAPPDFYDPTSDERDEKWIQKQRGGRQSDAHLSCPGCFTTLCTDCQQHASAPHRYRAVFVLNCRIDKNVQQETRQAGQRRGKRRRGQGPPADLTSDGIFHPVFCSECGSKVGAWSPDDVYHFFSVIASTA